MDPTESEISAALKEHGYILVKNFVSLADCAKLQSAVDIFAEKHYTTQNLASHAAYISDVKIGRKSWAFAVKNPINPPDDNLPSIRFSDETETDKYVPRTRTVLLIIMVCIALVAY